MSKPKEHTNNLLCTQCDWLNAQRQTHRDIGRGRDRETGAEADAEAETQRLRGRGRDTKAEAEAEAEAEAKPPGRAPCNMQTF